MSLNEAGIYIENIIEDDFSAMRRIIPSAEI